MTPNRGAARGAQAIPRSLPPENLIHSGAAGATPAGATPTIGTILGGTYRIVRPLAEGGCGNIFVAAHMRLGSQVAVKILQPSLGAEQALARFRQEADIMSALRHPHIVQILDFNFTEQGVPFLVMELLDGRSLSQDMASGEPFDPFAAFHIIEQIAQALESAHTHGVVHLDLKPDNVILISTDGRDDFVKIIDFGISRASWRAGLVNEPLVTGTPEYMAPEQARGLGEKIDHRADQFSTAAVAYTLLTGREPFNGHGPASLLYQVVNEVPRPPSELAPWLSAGVDDVIARAMSKYAADRYPGVMAFAEALRQVIVRDLDRRAKPALSVEASPPPEAPEAASLPPAPAPPVEVSPPPEVPSEPDTGRFIRKSQSQFRNRRSRKVLLTLAAAAAFAWFLPATRDRTRDAWHRAGAEARRLVGTAIASP